MSTEQKFKPTPARTLRAIFLHSQWLHSGARHGRRLGSDSQTFDFRGQDLDYVDLSMATLIDSDFGGSSLRNTWFVAADGYGCVFQDAASIDGSHFEYAHLRHANFHGLDRQSARFDHTKTEGSLWTPEDLVAFDEEMSREGELVKAKVQAGRDFESILFDLWRHDFDPDTPDHWAAWRMMKSGAILDL